MFGDLQVVDHVDQAFAELVADRSPSSLALSGGAVARRCYELLATADVDWGPVDVWFGDERWVPVHDPDSNEGMARVTFLDAVGPRAVHSMYDPDLSIGEAAAAYDDALHAASPLDLVHLGLGPDGHTASLFPANASLAETDRWVVATRDDQHAHDRLTLTFTALASAGLVVFTVAGREKHEALQRVLAGDDVPAGRVRAAEVVWLVDDEAFGPA